MHLLLFLKLVVCSVFSKFRWVPPPVGPTRRVNFLDLAPGYTVKLFKVFFFLFVNCCFFFLSRFLLKQRKHLTDEDYLLFLFSSRFDPATMRMPLVANTGLAVLLCSDSLPFSPSSPSIPTGLNQLNPRKCVQSIIHLKLFSLQKKKKKNNA